MKAQISAKGVLSISPETPLEAFAMNAWVKANVGMCKVHDSGATTFEVSNLIFEFNGDYLCPEGVHVLR